MQTQVLSISEKQLNYSQMPNGSFLVSGNLGHETRTSGVVYDVFIAGGRLADDDEPGAALALAFTIDELKDEAFAGLSDQGALRVELHGSYLHLRYVHNGHDQQGTERLIRILEKISTVKKLRRSLRIEDRGYLLPTERFWSWFYARTTPNWHRMILDAREERCRAARVKANDLKIYRDKCFQPANYLVYSTNDDRHEELAEQLMLLNGREEARELRPKIPDMHILFDDYADSTLRGGKKRTLFYLPFPTDRNRFFMACLALKAVYGGDGFFSKYAEAHIGAGVKIEISAQYWPQPMGCLLLEAPQNRCEKITDLIYTAPMGFCSISHSLQAMMFYSIAKGVYDVFGMPQSLLLDRWLCHRRLECEPLDMIDFRDLISTAYEYLHESRFGMITNVFQDNKRPLLCGNLL